MTTRHEGAPRDWVERFKSGALHLVCVASGGLTTCDFAASTVGGMRQEQEVWPLTRRVNHLAETRTFWPRLPLTVVPQTSWEGRAAPEDLDAFYRRVFDDVAEVNRNRVKLPDLFVDLNPYGGQFDRDAALPIAWDVLSCERTIVNIWFAAQVT